MPTDVLVCVAAAALILLWQVAEALWGPLPLPFRLPARPGEKRRG